MNKIIFGFVILFVSASVSSAALDKGTLNIFAESEDIELYVDLNFAGRGLASVVDLKPGKHYVKGILNGQTIFSEIADVDSEKVNSVLIKIPPKAVAPPSQEEYAKPKTLENSWLTEKDFKQYGFGFEIGWPFYGIDFDFWPVKEHGLSINYYSSSTSANLASQHYSARYKYRFAENAYLALGGGKYTDKRVDYYSYTYDSIEYSETLAAILFGIILNEYSTFEFGYGQKILESGVTSGMVTFSTGIHYYF